MLWVVVWKSVAIILQLIGVGCHTAGKSNWNYVLCGVLLPDILAFFSPVVEYCFPNNCCFNVKNGRKYCWMSVVAKVMACVLCCAIHGSLCPACLLTLVSGAFSYMAKRACDDVSKRKKDLTVLPFHSSRPSFPTSGSTSTGDRPAQRVDRNTMPHNGAAYNLASDVKQKRRKRRKKRRE